MPSLGMPELILILILALIVFGPRKLPEVGRSLGKTINEFRRASISSFSEMNEATKEINDEIQQATKTVQEKIK